jgi:hypothetical protein
MSIAKTPQLRQNLWFFACQSQTAGCRREATLNLLARIGDCWQAAEDGPRTTNEFELSAFRFELTTEN